MGGREEDGKEQAREKKRGWVGWEGWRDEAKEKGRRNQFLLTFPLKY